MGVAKVRLLGEEITLRGVEESAYLERLASEVEALLKRMSADLNIQSQPTRTALLVAINLQDELNRLKEKHQDLELGTSAAAAQMVKRIEHTLSLDTAAPAHPNA